jgi:hypothetical protein
MADESSAVFSTGASGYFQDAMGTDGQLPAAGGQTLARLVGASAHLARLPRLLVGATPELRMRGAPRASYGFRPTSSHGDPQHPVCS